MGLAALSAPTWVLNVDGHGKVALASFVCVGTIVALSSALILYTLLANSAYTRDYWIILVSSVALPAGYFGVGAVVLKN